ncbi:MAG TPA: hypothetical protein VHA14_08170 [Bryobacteraceae bacterium]|nr:hypothetical protein [Bryobacteraceae bacterium]
MPDELLQRVDARSRESGLGREDYIRAVLSREVIGSPSLSEILKPFREEVQASGATDDELARLFAAARDECDRERKRSASDERAGLIGCASALRGPAVR